MAYYLATYNGKNYANRALAKAVYGIGDAGLLVLIDDQKIRTERILNVLAYELNESVVPRAKELCGENEQDIGAVVGKFSSPRKGDARYTLREKCNKYRLGGVSFLPVAYITDPTKYRLLKKLPSISFFGKQYIALDVRTEDEGTCVAELKSN